MITSSGTKCDVCGDYILLEDVHQIGFNVLKGRLDCHKRCEEKMKEWSKGSMVPTEAIPNLPDGPLKSEMERLYKDMLDGE